MPELLIELYSEEIPAGMQSSAIERFYTTLQTKFEEGCKEKVQGEYWVTPKRMGAVFNNVPAKLTSTVEELRGPKLDAPEVALQGFLKKYNLQKESLYQKDGYYFAQVKQGSDDIHAFLKETIEEVLHKFTWPKSMRWGEHDITWVRPLHNILCLFDGMVLPVKFGHVTANNKSRGHRFMAPQEFTVANHLDYLKNIEEHKVILNQGVRGEKIKSQAAALLTTLGLSLKEDKALLDEVVGLVEYPAVYLGEIDAKFMYLPEEALIITLKHHQRYLMVEDKNGKLAPYYLIVANIEASDSGKEIRHGNGKVLRARLEDAIFHYEHDKAQELEDFVEKLRSLTYHQQIGSVYDKMQSVLKLAELIAKDANADVEKVKRAVTLCKADLVSNMVKEFPELQGVMGYYYAKHAGEPDEVALAIKEHYKPQGPTDSLPSNLTGAIVALADKLDTLNQMFAINIKPTGSKDPFALRRAAIGILRICEHYDIRALGARPDVAQFINERKENLSN